MSKYRKGTSTNGGEVWTALRALTSERVKTQFAGGVAISGEEIVRGEENAFDFYSSTQGANNGFHVSRAILHAKMVAAQRQAEASMDAQGFET